MFIVQYIEVGYDLPLACVHESVSCGAARKTASEKMRNFRAVPKLTEGSEEAWESPAGKTNLINQSISVLKG